MKNLTNTILVSFLIVGFVALGFAHSASMPQNKLDNSARYTLSENTSQSKQTSTLICEDMPGKILRVINNSPKPLKDQFRNGTITYSYGEKRLIFMGYIHGNGSNIRSLINGFDGLRDEVCLRVISFEGASPGSNFEWRADADIQPPDPNNRCEVGSVIENVVGNQLNKTLFYYYDKNTRVLEFRGHIGDARGRGKFNSLIAQLQRFMKNGCLAKMVFAPDTNPKGKTSAQVNELMGVGCATKTAISMTKISYTPKTEIIEKLLFNRGFEWQICEYPSCECAGECRTCPC